MADHTQLLTDSNDILGKICAALLKTQDGCGCIRVFRGTHQEVHCCSAHGYLREAAEKDLPGLQNRIESALRVTA